MAIKWLDNFNHYIAGTADMRNQYWANGCYCSNSYGRTGRGLSCGYGDWVYVDFADMLGWTTTEFYMGVAIKHNGYDFGYGFGAFGYMTSSNYYHCNLYYNTNGTWQLRDSANATVQTSTVLYDIGVWTHYEWHVKMGGAGVGESTFKKNGQVILYDNTADYSYSTYTTIRGIKFGVDSTYMDDVYVDDAKFRGDIEIITIYPTSDGTYSDFTRNTGSNDYEAVDDTESDDDTTYIEGTAVGDQSTFGFDASSVSGKIEGVVLINRLKKTQGDYAEAKNLALVGGTDYYGSLAFPMSYNYLFCSSVFPTNPDTSNLWTPTTISNAEFGLEITALTTTTTTV